MSAGVTTFRGGKNNKSAQLTSGKSRTVFSMVQSSKRTEMEKAEKERQEKEKIEKEQRKQLSNIPRLRKKDKFDLRNELIRQHEDNMRPVQAHQQLCEQGGQPQASSPTINYTSTIRLIN
jgi:hypothetical protein